jgi:hypothetical protein
VIKKLLGLSMMLTMAACLNSAPSEDKSTSEDPSTSTTASGLLQGTCRYICTRIVGDNEYQLDDTDPNNPPNRCGGNNVCTAPNPLTCATPGLVSNTPCQAAVIIGD